MHFLPAGFHVDHGWLRPARACIALGGEPLRRNEQFAIIAMEPEPPQDQVHGRLEEVTEFLQQEFLVRVISAFPSPLGLGLFEFDNQIQREVLLDASLIQFAHGLLTIQKHDEARNLRSCHYTRECYLMFLGFPLDYQLIDVIKAAVAPFGRLIRWFEGPNKSRVLVKCLVLTLERVPHSLVISQGSLLGGNGRSWSVHVFILNGHFPDGFPKKRIWCLLMVFLVQKNGHVHPGNPNAQ